MEIKADQIITLIENIAASYSASKPDLSSVTDSSDDSEPRYIYKVPPNFTPSLGEISNQIIYLQVSIHYRINNSVSDCPSNAVYLQSKNHRYHHPSRNAQPSANNGKLALN
jgi:hypothetical protein